MNVTVLKSACKFPAFILSSILDFVTKGASWSAATERLLIPNGANRVQAVFLSLCLHIAHPNLIPVSFLVQSQFAA